MTEVTVSSGRCKGCGLCAAVCRVGGISVDSGAYSVYGGGCAVVNDKCVGCGQCAVICPDIAISIRKEPVK